jgi:hypothetical protein
MDPTVLVAIVAAGVVAGVVAGRLQRMAKRNPPAPSSAPVDDSSLPLSTADQRFRLLSFQGGSVPADLGPMLEELRRNGIEVDEETLRRKLAENAAAREHAVRAGGDEQQAGPAAREHPAGAGEEERPDEGNETT